MGKVKFIIRDYFISFNQIFLIIIGDPFDVCSYHIIDNIQFRLKRFKFIKHKNLNYYLGILFYFLNDLIEI